MGFRGILVMSGYTDEYMVFSRRVEWRWFFGLFLLFFFGNKRQLNYRDDHVHCIVGKNRPLALHPSRQLVNSSSSVLRYELIDFNKLHHCV